MRRALVTGGSRGIGLAIARRLARDGLDVFITYAHDEDQAKAAAWQARSEGLRITSARCDAGDPAAWQDLFKRVQTLSEDGVEVLVHAAGFTHDHLLMTMAPADFDSVLQVHLRGGFLAAQTCMRGMIAQRWGRIVFVTSPTAMLGRRGQTNYGAAKAGLHGLMRSLMREVSRFQITVNCVSAGLVDTALTQEISQSIQMELLASVPMQRSGTPDEIAALVGFLASERAGYITGQSLAVDGGLDTLSAAPEAW